MNLLDDLRWRGLVHQVTDETVVRAAFAHGTTAYIGFDPTGASLHVGSLLQIVNLVRLAKGGQRAIAVVGGGTGMIGDPSGKTSERMLMTPQGVAANVALLSGQLQGFFDRAGVDVAIVNNGAWLDSLGLVTFLRDIGKHFSVNAMVQRDSVKTRLAERDQGISFTEFSYMLLQAYDFLELYRGHGCAGQVGGSDQWGNIVSGLDLIDRIARGGTPSAQSPAPWGLTVPLVTTKSGQKFGKTEAGAMWLDAALTSPYQLYQFWVNADDTDVDRYLRFFTFLSQEQHSELMARHTADPQARHAQKALAREVLALCHPGAVDAVLAATAVLFGGNPTQASPEALEVVAREVATVQVGAGATAHAVLVGDNRLFASNGEARRAIAAQAVTISGQKWTADLATVLPPDLWLHDKYALVRHGKKSWALAVRRD